MGFANNIGKYHLGRTIGEGTFAKVKMAVDSTTGHHVAIKIIDKHMVMQSNLEYQVNFHLVFLFLFWLFPLWEVSLIPTTPNMLLYNTFETLI